ncbi:uncharacterized protein LOC116290090 [Actinia tenebrosa]|uniref:Uncharacterized protein LOC116290090 n=1 Tax=Actinia tenebrosa TaxID=6105 RepID=A0A6P8HJR8_ACTTE|nr:uncharacterized protein LOC116290090 [Actinia tenebrosa]
MAMITVFFTLLRKFYAIFVLCLYVTTVDSQTKNPEFPEFPPKIIPSDNPSIPTGHLKPFGYQRPPDGHVKEYKTVLHPKEFWNNHVSQNKPAVFRQAVSKSSAISNWVDEYLKDHYGDLDVLIELKKENRSFSAQRTTLGTFIDNYNEKDVYVVTVLPDPMRKDIQVPSCLLCGSFVDYIHETNFWMSSGGTRSVIHFDADHILHCLVAGQKDWMLINQQHVDDLYMERRSKFSGSGFTLIDPDKVDMLEYPRVANVSWQYTTLQPGDCVFLPSEYIHQVRSYIRSISVTMLFTTETNNTFNPKGCDKADLDSVVTLDKVNVHWTYNKGDNFIEMGYMNVEMLRETLLTGLKRSKTDKLTLEGFKNFWSLSMDEDEEGPGPEVAFEKLLKSVNKISYLTKEDIKNLPRDALKELARVMDPPHGPKEEKKLVDDDLDIRKSNTYDYNESEDEEDNEKNLRIEL